MNKVIEAESLRSDKCGSQVKERKEGNVFRISIFFDYNNDNYHIQFPERADRKKVGNLLHELADRVLQRKV